MKGEGQGFGKEGKGGRTVGGTKRNMEGKGELEEVGMGRAGKGRKRRRRKLLCKQ
jgi:hypothetical protein